MARDPDAREELIAWLEERAEPAPGSLHQPLAEAVRAVDPAASGTLGGLSAIAGEQLLAKLLSDGCDHRAAALQLLAADALVTYAFEAAAEDASQAARAIDMRAAQAMRRVATLGEGE